MLKFKMKKRVRRFPTSAPNASISAAIEAIREKAEDAGLEERLSRCQEALSKYPLKIPTVDGCKILRGFNDEVVRKIKVRVLHSSMLNRNKTFFG